jgi:hypothetical protein
VSDPRDTGLAEQVHAFAATLDSLVEKCLPRAPGITVTSFDDRFTIVPGDQHSEKKGGVPLAVQGDVLAYLRFNYLCRFDVTREFLAIDKSKVWIVAAVDNTPIFRYEFLYEADRVPHSHIQVHGQRGALSHLLSKAGHPSPHDMAALHLPTGGARFRPNLEDVIQFLIVDCRFDSLSTWRQAVDRERAASRVIQTRSVVRAMADVAAGQLERMGYAVTPPNEGHPPRGGRAQFAW